MAIKSSNLESGNLEKLLEVRYINEDIGKCLCIIYCTVLACVNVNVNVRHTY